MKNIKLFARNGAWIARTDDAEAIRLFGTPDLPTAFTAQTDADQVLAAIQRLNPNAHVSIIPNPIP
jgi:hypothetical protein